jgi:DNA-directed RNA polymerase subunit omega
LTTSAGKRALPPGIPERGTIIATIDDLLSKVDSKYTLVHLAARRAREINNYYHSLGEGIGQYVRPLVESVDSNKPLSIALEEIATDKIVVAPQGDTRAQAEAMLGADLQDESDESEAEVVALSGDEDEEQG